VFNIPFGAVQNILHPLGRKGNAQTIRKLLIRHTQGVLQRGKRCYRILNGCHDETMTQNDFFVNCGDDNNNKKGPPLEEKAPKRLPKTRNWVYQRKWAKDLLASAMRCVSSRFLRAAPVSLAASIISEARRSRMVRSLRERAAVMIQRMDSA